VPQARFSAGCGTARIDENHVQSGEASARSRAFCFAPAGIEDTNHGRCPVNVRFAPRFGCRIMAKSAAKSWCRVRDLNPRPSVYKTAALPLC
jgi:hypothetical protein